MSGPKAVQHEYNNNGRYVSGRHPNYYSVETRGRTEGSSHETVPLFASSPLALVPLPRSWQVLGSTQLSGSPVDLSLFLPFPSLRTFYDFFHQFPFSISFQLLSSEVNDTYSYRWLSHNRVDISSISWQCGPRDRPLLLRFDVASSFWRAFLEPWK